MSEHMKFPTKSLYALLAAYGVNPNHCSEMRLVAGEPLRAKVLVLDADGKSIPDPENSEERVTEWRDFPYPPEETS